jgi:hypothetical protein
MHLNIGNQLIRILSSGLVYIDLFFHQQGALLVGVLVLSVMGKWQKEILLTY